MSTKDYKTRDEIVISVGGPGDGKGGGKRTRRRGGSAAPGRKGRKYLPRRKTGQITFYDPGQILSAGDWIDNSFAVTPVWVAVGETLIPIRSILVSDYTERDAAVLAPDRATWKTVFRKIAKNPQAINYDISVNWGDGLSEGGEISTLHEWTPAGLALDAADLQHGFVISSGREFFEPVIVLNDPDPDNPAGKIKVTETRDFAADPVTFPLNPKMDIFLMPALSLAGGESFGYSHIFNNGTVAFAAGVQQKLNNTYLTVPRQPLIDTGDAPWSGSWARNSGATAAEYAAAYQAAVFHRSLPFARVRSGFDTFAPPNLVVVVWTSDPGSAFPYPTIFPPPPGYPNEHAPPFPEARNFEVGFTRLDGAGLLDDGVLLAVIFTAGKWFYIWSNRSA